MTRIIPTTKPRPRLAVLVATTLAVMSASTGAMAGTSNNASAGNDRTMSTQYSRTLLPIGGTKGESNRWDRSYWTGVSTRVASKPETLRYGFYNTDYYSRGMVYSDGRPYHGYWKNSW